MDHERAVCRWFDQQASAILERKLPSDEESLERFVSPLAVPGRSCSIKEFPTTRIMCRLVNQPSDEIRSLKGLLRSPSPRRRTAVAHDERPGRDLTATLIWTSEARERRGF